MTTKLFVIVNIKQLRTDGSFRILLPFFEHLVVFEFYIQQFLTVSKSGLAKFWRAFVISEGRGVQSTPHPSVRNYCHFLLYRQTKIDILKLKGHK